MDVKLRAGGRIGKPCSDLKDKIIETAKQISNNKTVDNLHYALKELMYHGYFDKDLSKYDVCAENIIDEDSGKTSTGINYVSFGYGGDWEQPAMAFIYWDGSRLRGYLPLKGNLINTVNKSAFGNGYDQTPNSDDVYCLKEFGKTYDDVYDQLNINFSACLEDFSSRVENI